MALSDQLIGFWELGEASGTRNDSHGVQHLVDNNTVTQNTGKVGNCGQFTSANSEYLSRANEAALQTGDIDFSLCCWVYADSTAPASMILVKGTGNATGAQDDYALYYTSTLGKFRFFVSNGGGSFGVKSADSLGTFFAATWYFLVAWHDATANTVNIQVNNGTVDSVSYSLGGNGGSTSSFRIGWDSVYDYWNGRIDQVGFWKRVLTSQERTALYNGGAGLSYASMVAVGGVSLLNGGLAKGSLIRGGRLVGV